MHLYLFTYKYHNAVTLPIVLYYNKGMQMYIVKIIAIMAKKMFRNLDITVIFMNLL